jgi:hypothetical protein
VRGRDELEIILNKTGKENEEKYSRLARLDLALKYQEMPVNRLFVYLTKLFFTQNYLILSLILFLFFF